MLSITQEQWNVLQSKSEVAFYQKVKQAFKADHSDLVKNIPDDQLSQLIIDSTDLARKSHITQELYVVNFIGYVIEFGKDFVEQDKVCEHKDWLENEHVPAKFKIDRLQHCLQRRYFE